MISLRAPKLDELPELSALCMRSKAYWGYDDAFMQACRDELTVQAKDLKPGLVVVAVFDSKPAGIGELLRDGEVFEIGKLFVDPDSMGRGIGARLMQWCIDTARAQGGSVLRIEADPQAAPFYERFGAVRIGEAPSGSIPGRCLPLLELVLR